MNDSSSRTARLVLAIFMSHSATRYLHLLAGVLCLYPRYLQTLISPTIELCAILQRISQLSQFAEPSARGCRPAACALKMQKVWVCEFMYSPILYS